MHQKEAKAAISFKLALFSGQLTLIFELPD